MWATHTGTSSVLKKKNQVKSPSPESRVPETGSDPPIGSDRDLGHDKIDYSDQVMQPKSQISSSYIAHKALAPGAQ